MRAKRIGPALACAAAAVLAGCGADGPAGPPPPVPGTLTVTLATPAADDRAILVSVTGPAAPGEVAAGSAGYVVHARASGTTLRAAVFGRLGSGPLLRFAVPDVNRAAEYSATAQEVVDPENVPAPQPPGTR